MDAAKEEKAAGIRLTEAVILIQGKNVIQEPSVAIVILNWNGFDDTVECLHALRQTTHINLKVKMLILLCVPDVIVYHGHWATFGKETYLLERNRYYYIIKNIPRDMLLIFIKCSPAAFLSSLMQLLKARSFQQERAFLRGNLRGLAGLPCMFTKRRKLRSCGQMHDSELRKWLSK